MGESTDVPVLRSYTRAAVERFVNYKVLRSRLFLHVSTFKNYLFRGSQIQLPVTNPFPI